MRNLFGYVGRAFIAFLGILSRIYFLFRETLVQSRIVLHDPVRRGQAGILRRIDEVGARSLPLVMTVSAFLGIAFTVLVSFQLRELGALSYLPGFVAVALLREVGPLITALIIAGRVGAAFTSRIGTMKVAEEILALETMAINPVRFLVVNRFLAMLVSLPALTVIASVTALAGGFLYGNLRLGITLDTYLRETLDVIVFKDVYSGLLKSVVFAAVIVLVGCDRGFAVEGGAEGVGRATMLAVVSSTLTIIVFDTIMTTAFYG
ncbi:MAG: hypothetical protein A2X56_00510 [Nitrospirae bacterium GWC2_57_13]|jgi:phospholipid/cholesterol/gamma-HCH transport system permease protein|nr:MAG: hypothetical protein A2072_03775 [Nitrospirae bacterium GWC1_57_7]OGW28656.1 MAG: hypothetical protein A2X56_00510 [Nitrospirae bacterium GWC2_57_13]HAR46685.1 ABC transporter permease [Nitrospiraceae bacterium]